MVPVGRLSARGEEGERKGRGRKKGWKRGREEEEERQLPEMVGGLMVATNEESGDRGVLLARVVLVEGVEAAVLGRAGEGV